MDKKYVSNRPNISKKELKGMFPYICADRIDHEVKTNKYATLKGFLRYMQGINDEYRQRAEKPDVKRLSISIEWHRSRTWGNCPRAYFSCYYADGTYESGEARASGCGYDKESTVVADIMNRVCSGMAYRKRNTRKEPPYGLSIKGYWFPHFDGGVGMSCYYHVVSFLGGKLENTGSGRTYDHYEITFPTKKA